MIAAKTLRPDVADNDPQIRTSERELSRVVRSVVIEQLLVGCSVCDHPPPVDVRGERALLGALIDNHATAEDLGTLDASELADPTLAAMFTVAAHVIRAGKKLSWEGIVLALEADDRPMTAAAWEWHREVIRTAAPGMFGAGIAQLARRLQRLAMRRDVLRMLAGLIADVRVSDLSNDQIVERLREIAVRVKETR